MIRLVIFSGGDLADIARLVQRIEREARGTRVLGVILERRTGKSLPRRLAGFARSLGQPGFLPYAAGRVGAALRGQSAALGHVALRLVHAAPRRLAAPPPALPCELLVTDDLHGEQVLEQLRSWWPDLGVVYGTGILRPELFRLPRLGCINLHKRKVPDYRGGGPVGLWELLAGESEIGVTVHQVEARVDTGAVLARATIPIQPFDTLSSLAHKAHVTGNDLIVRAVADIAAGRAAPQPQQGRGRTYRAPRPAELQRLTRRIEARRPRYRPRRNRPAYKLVAKSALALPGVIARNWLCRARGSFPVVVLFTHLVTERPHRLGMPIDQFVRQVDFLRRHYRIVGLEEAAALLRAGGAPEPTVVLTFDDGYADNFLTLRAVAERTGVPMSLFVSTAHIESGRPFEHDVQFREPGFAPLSWEQLRQMAAEGFAIGAHTRTHFDCGSRDPALLEQEIAGAARDIEARLGLRPELFSFPFGLPENVSREAMQIACAAYPLVLTAWGGSNAAPAGGVVQHLKRWSQPADLWELELLVQSVLERERAAPELPAAADEQPQCATDLPASIASARTS